MARLTDANVAIAREIIGALPAPEVGAHPAAAPGPGAGRLRHRGRHGAHRRAGRRHAGRGATAPATFYEMFKFEPVGRYVRQRLHEHLVPAGSAAWSCCEHAEERLGVKAGSTTPDGLFTLEDVECIAACTEAPCLQVNYRYRYKVTDADFDRLIDDLAAGPARRRDPAARHAGPRPPEGGRRPVGRHRQRWPRRRSDAR